jgi:hypothetical protein
MIMTNYSLDIQQIGQNKQIYTDCNSISIINQGTNDIIIDQMITVSPGQSFVIEGNEGETCRHRFFLAFTGAGTSNCVVIRKLYINI